MTWQMKKVGLIATDLVAAIDNVISNLEVDNPSIEGASEDGPRIKILRLRAATISNGDSNTHAHPVLTPLLSLPGSSIAYMGTGVSMSIVGGLMSFPNGDLHCVREEIGLLLHAHARDGKDLR
jgi:hypothetical protein